MDNILITLQQVLILAIEIGVGFIAAKRGKLKKEHLSLLTFLCATLALPCSIVYPIINLDNSPQMWRDLSTGILVMLILMVIQIAVSLMMFRKNPQPTRAVYQMCMIYCNSAFMGIPLISAILGGDAVIYATLMVIFDTVFMFAHAALCEPGARLDMKMIVKRIFGLATISMLVGLAILISGIRLPSLVLQCITDIKGMTTPVAMLIVGVQLAQQNLRKIFTIPRHYIVAGMKLIGWPFIIGLLLYPFRNHISSLAVVTILICKGTSQPAVIGVLAGQHHLDDDAAASIIGLTTVCSILTLPIIAGLSKTIFL